MKTALSTKPLRAALVMLCLSLSLLGVSAPAVAKQADTAEIESFWSSYNVPRDVQVKLLKKINAGEMTEANKSAAEPVNEETVDRDGFRSTVKTFADGSIAVTSLELPTEAVPAAEGQVTPMASISSCTTYGGAGWASYQGCLINHRTDTIYIEFRATYEKYQGAYAQITNHWGGYIQTYGGVVAVDSPHVTYYVRSSGTYGQAVVQYSSTVKNWANSYSETVQLSLRVGTAGNAWVTNY
ncbi:hypothetical protein [Pseudarthrobacter sp. NamE5]|uniref:hypothetical protein n=1 Tax=Pseudarthrobacter sp. NamE5 TaxID=2576839 RepID=UPI00110A48FB|nr:hypothetical protein [Pseudarthrobacter sp. NamE5]TLM88227.1 hypothetical protein FDW84_01550 [Pseudarthrobacter sp. NamE5]